LVTFGAQQSWPHAGSGAIARSSTVVCAPSVVSRQPVSAMMIRIDMVRMQQSYARNRSRTIASR